MGGLIVGGKTKAVSHVFEGFSSEDVCGFKIVVQMPPLFIDFCWDQSKNL